MADKGPYMRLVRLAIARPVSTLLVGAAVLAGVDTEPHRQAVSAIEADIARERTRQQEAAAAEAQQRASAVADRAAELAAGSHHRVASCIPPLPTRPESTNDEH